ncbi:hypothetical protein [Sinorhizobium meliloti]|uniref:hypothetical protein n=1 Tax=Rhizobium meliloti TaxID=382 RepID=UPI0013E31966|nr:hypothetical protein [Sinorhizobium meliloti]
MICLMACLWVNADFFTGMPTTSVPIYIYARAADQNFTPSVMRRGGLAYRSGRVASILINTVAFPIEISTSLRSFGSARGEAVCTLGEGLAEASFPARCGLTQTWHVAFLPRLYADYDMNDGRQLPPFCGRESQDSCQFWLTSAKDGFVVCFSYLSADELKSLANQALSQT